MSNAPANLITSEQAAKRVGVCVKRIQALLRANRITGAVRFSGRWLIPTDFTVVEAQGSRARPGRRGPMMKYHQRLARAKAKAEKQNS